jgi:hypothetical protein
LDWAAAIKIDASQRIKVRREVFTFGQGDVEEVGLPMGGGVGAAVGTGGGVKPSGAITPKEVALVATLPLALAEFVKYLSSICGETSASGAVADSGPVTNLRASDPSASPLVAVPGAAGPLAAMALSGALAGIGGVVREMGAEPGGGGKRGGRKGGGKELLTWLTMGAQGTRKRKGSGPALGK